MTVSFFFLKRERKREDLYFYLWWDAVWLWCVYLHQCQSVKYYILSACDGILELEDVGCHVMSALIFVIIYYVLLYPGRQVGPSAFVGALLQKVRCVCYLWAQSPPSPSRSRSKQPFCCFVVRGQPAWCMMSQLIRFLGGCLALGYFIFSY